MSYENLVKLEFQRQCSEAYISDGGIRMYITARFSVPSSASKRKVTAMLDKLAKTNVIHKNKAANLKSSVQLHVNAL